MQGAAQGKSQIPNPKLQIPTSVGVEDFAVARDFSGPSVAVAEPCCKTPWISSVARLRPRGTPVAPATAQGGGQDAMFDLFTGKVQHVPSTPAIPSLVSSTIQASALTIIAVMSFVVASRELPPVPDMLAFAAEMPAVAPPPPPPPPAPAAPAPP